MAAVALPDWLTARLAGRPAPDSTGARSTVRSPPTPATPPALLLAGDAPGGPTSPSALGHEAAPTLAAPGAVVGTTATGAAVSAGTGDNMAAALDLGLVPGDVVVSIGTSETASPSPRHRRRPTSGILAGFCDATGRYLPLVCTINASSPPPPAWSAGRSSADEAASRRRPVPTG